MKKWGRKRNVLAFLLVGVVLLAHPTWAKEMIVQEEAVLQESLTEKESSVSSEKEKIVQKNITPDETKNEIGTVPVLAAANTNATCSTWAEVCNAVNGKTGNITITLSKDVTATSRVCEISKGATVTIKNTSGSTKAIKRGNSATKKYNFHLFNVNAGGTLNIGGTASKNYIKLQGGTSATNYYPSNSSMIYINGGTVNCGRYCEFWYADSSYHTSSLLNDKGGAVAVARGGVCNVNGAKFAYCKSTSAGAIEVQYGGTLAINSGEFSGCRATENGGAGGAIKVEGGATFSMKSGTIGTKAAPNAATYGGGIFVAEGAGGEISGGTIAYNTAASTGGGITITGNYAVSNVVVTGNAAPKGGGVYVTSSGTNKISGCQITYNTATDGGSHGGGVLISSAGRLQIEGCVIDENNGAGVRNNGALTVSGSNIRNNTNAGIHAIADSRLTLTNQISYCTGNKGDGVVANGSTVIYSGMFNSNGANGISISGQTQIDAETYHSDVYTGGNVGAGIAISAAGACQIKSVAVPDYQPGNGKYGLFQSYLNQGAGIRNQGNLQLKGGNIYRNQGHGIASGSNATQTKVYGKTYIDYNGYDANSNKISTANGISNSGKNCTVQGSVLICGNTNHGLYNGAAGEVYMNDTFLWNNTDGYALLNDGTMEVGNIYVGMYEYVNDQQWKTSISANGGCVKNTAQLKFSSGTAARLYGGTKTAMENTGTVEMNHSYPQFYCTSASAVIKNSGVINAEIVHQSGVMAGVKGANCTYGIYNTGVLNWGMGIYGNEQTAETGIRSYNETGCIQNGIYNAGTTSLLDGVISKCKVGVVNQNEGVIYQTGGTIAENVQYGVYQNGMYYMSGGAKIDSSNHVYLPEQHYITVNGALSTNGMCAVLKPEKEYLARVLVNVKASGLSASDVLYSKNGKRFCMVTELGEKTEELVRAGDKVDEEIFRNERNALYSTAQKQFEKEEIKNSIFLSEKYEVRYEEYMRDENGAHVLDSAGEKIKTTCNNASPQIKYWCENLSLSNANPEVKSEKFRKIYQFKYWSLAEKLNESIVEKPYVYKENKDNTFYQIWNASFEMHYMRNLSVGKRDVLMAKDTECSYQKPYTFLTYESEDGDVRGETMEVSGGNVVSHKSKETLLRSERAEDGTITVFSLVGYCVNPNAAVDGVDKERADRIYTVYQENEQEDQPSETILAEYERYQKTIGDSQAENVMKGEDNTNKVTVYAIWDAAPVIKAETLYFSVEEAQQTDGKGNGITKERLLDYAAVNDDTEGVVLEVEDYQPEKLQTVTDGTIEQFTYRATDRAGNITRKEVEIHFVDTSTIEMREKQKNMRFISYEYIDTLENDSKWKTDEAYYKTLTAVLENVKYHEETTKIDEKNFLGVSFEQEKAGSGKWKSAPKQTWEIENEK